MHNPFDHNTLGALAVAPSPPVTHENNLISETVLMLLSVLICGIIHYKKTAVF
ncbi:BnaAnng19840D [Brassica napus]|uniref:BnaAnng19840D protein n=2 Tax=Brassica TaxID=3705 RepID=A0A078JE69_BRANA|nr:BnaAnng19840D [Brassica napus]